MSRSTSLKAVFFDLDNVLVFSETKHFQSWQNTMAHFGIDPNTLDFQNMIGKTDLSQAHVFQKEYSLAIEPAALLAMKRKSFFEITQNGFESPLGRNALLEKLNSFCVVGLVSSSGNDVIQNILQLEKIEHYFHFVLGFEDCEKHKPDPFPYQKALSIAKVQREEALVVEDSFSGITSALQAEIPVVGILKDQAPDQLISDVTYFNHFEEVDRWLSY